MTEKPTDKPFTQMTAEELAEQTAEFDREFAAESFHSLSAQDQARWERVQRKVLPAAGGAGETVVPVKVDPELLDRTDALARKMQTTRDALIARALRTLLVATGEM